MMASAHADAPRRQRIAFARPVPATHSTTNDTRASHRQVGSATKPASREATVRSVMQGLSTQLGLRVHRRPVYVQPRRSASVAVGQMAIVLGGLVACAAQAQVPASPFSYSRTSSFSYYGASDGSKNGLLKTETVEPDSAEGCVITTHNYDAWGNKASATTANCTAVVPTDDAKFDSRAATQAFSRSTMPSVTVGGKTHLLQAGQFPLDATNAASHASKQLFDPRFGLPIEIIDANGAKTTIEYDELGRKVKQQIFNEGITFSQGAIWRYCVLANKGVSATTNSSGCTNPASAPADALQYVQSWPIGSSGTQIGAWTIAYTDRAGRAIRGVTQGFDGPDQPAAAKGADIVQDTVYNAYGAVTLKSQPYWLTSGSSATSGANNAGATKFEVDMLGRPKAVYVADAQGSRANIVFGASAFSGYGAYGTRTSAVTTYSYAGLKTTVTDDKGRVSTQEKNPIGEVVRTTDATGAQIVQQYEAFGALRYTKDPLGNTNWVTTTVRGFKATLTDRDAGYTSYGYNALGELKWQRNAKQAAKNPATRTELKYDKLGRLIERKADEYTSTWYFDADAGGITCGKGRLCEARTSHQVRKRYWYDSFGRPSSERTDIGPIGAATRSWAQSRSWSDTNGRLLSSAWPSGIKVDYEYTVTLGSLTQLKLSPSATIQPLPVTVGGTPGAQVNWAAGKVLWRAEAFNAWGQSERSSTGSATDTTTVTTRDGFDGLTGRLLTRRAGLSAGTGLLSQDYSWDSLNRLVTRIDNNGDGTRNTGNNLMPVWDTFDYDSLNRLIRTTTQNEAIPGGVREVQLAYNALGMLLKRSDTGAYVYPAVVAGQTTVRPHALASYIPNNGASTVTYGYDAAGNLTTSSGGKYRSIAYTSFNQPDENAGLQGPAGATKYTWQYDENQARIKEIQTIASGTLAGTRTTWRAHPDNAGGLSFEHEDNAPTIPSAANPDVDQSRHYLSIGGRAIAVFVTEGALPTLSSTAKAPTVLTTVVLRKVEYWHTDHLGSVSATSDHSGIITSRYSYDPFGQRRQANGLDDPGQTLNVDWDPARNRGTGNGFTGHEHLDDVGIVHMNGRIFDPRLGIFLQPDPLIQSPTNLQNYNRYAYCFNGPLGCTDPSGFFSLSDILMPGAGVHKYVDPGGYYILSQIAKNKYGYQIGSFAINIVSSVYCQNWAFACNAAGQAAWAGYAGASKNEALKIGLRAGISTGVNQLIGGIDNPLGNAATHVAWGCAENRLSGGSCSAGARAAFAQALFSRPETTYGNPYDNIGDLVVNTVVQAGVGGVASLAGGGGFADGARTAAYAYLFNELLHAGGGMARERLARSGYEGVADEGEFGVTWKPNYPDTVPVDGAAADALYCTARCVGNDVYATGGQELSGHSKGSHHYVGEAVDFRSLSVTSSKVLACSANCGFEAGWFESWGAPHWHFQLRPGNGVPRITPDPVIKRPSVRGP
jgi:RHS repeat-associated protein